MRGGEEGNLLTGEENNPVIARLIEGVNTHDMKYGNSTSPSIR